MVCTLACSSSFRRGRRAESLGNTNGTLRLTQSENALSKVKVMPLGVSFLCVGPIFGRSPRNIIIGHTTHVPTTTHTFALRRPILTARPHVMPPVFMSRAPFLMTRVVPKPLPTDSASRSSCKKLSLWQPKVFGHAPQVLPGVTWGGWGLTSYRLV